MTAKFKRRDADFKYKVALEAAKDLRQIKEIAREFQIHPKQVTEWRNRLLEGKDKIFDVRGKQYNSLVAENEELKKIIGKQTLELEYLKKKLKS